MSLRQSGSPAGSGSRQEAEKADSTFTIKSHSDDEPNGKTLYEDFIFNPEQVRVEWRDDFTTFLLQPVLATHDRNINSRLNIETMSTVLHCCYVIMMGFA